MEDETRAEERMDCIGVAGTSTFTSDSLIGQLFIGCHIPSSGKSTLIPPYGNKGGGSKNRRWMAGKAFVRYIFEMSMGAFYFRDEHGCVLFCAFYFRDEYGYVNGGSRRWNLIPATVCGDFLRPRKCTRGSPKAINSLLFINYYV